MLESSGFIYHLLPSRDFDGKHILAIIVKRTYKIKEGFSIPADEQLPIFFEDKPLNEKDPLNSSLLYESDIIPFKPKTDLVFIGKGYAENGKPLPSFEVQFSVGSHSKKLRIFGKRTCKYRPPKKETKKETIYTPPIISSPKPIASIDLIWENSYGGKSIYKFSEEQEGILIPCPTNPIGKGFAIGNNLESIDGLELPNIEDPYNLLTPEKIPVEITNLEKCEVPQNFGWYGKAWAPRVNYLGAMPYELENLRKTIKEHIKNVKFEKKEDEKTFKEYFEKFEPPQMKPEFYCAGALGLSVSYLEGNESVVLTNLTEEGKLIFRLPGHKLVAEVKRGIKEEKVNLNLDTLCILGEKKIFYIVWRGSLLLQDEKEAEEAVGYKVKIL